MRIYTLLLAFVAMSARAKTFKATTNGSWMAPQTWSCNCIPKSGDQISIPEGIIVIITKPVTARSMQITVSGELAFNNGTLQIDESDKIIVMPGGRVVAKAAGGVIYVGSKPHYFENGKVIAGPATIGKTVVPIVLMFFKADSNEGHVTLTWASAGEVKVRRYEILASTDSINFQTVGAVKASNNSVQRKGYTFPIGNATSGGEFYRLEAVRTDSSRMVLSTVGVK